VDGRLVVKLVDSAATRWMVEITPMLFAYSLKLLPVEGMDRSKSCELKTDVS